MSQLSLDWIISESFDIKAIDPSTIDTSQFDYENLITWIRTLSENSELQNIFSFFDTLSVHFFNERTPDSIQQAYRLKDLALAAQNTMVVHLSGELQALTDHYKKEMNAMSQMLQDLKSRLPPPESVAPINKKTKRTKPLTSSNTKKTKSSNNDMVLSNKFSALDNGTDIDTPATTVNDQANEIEITKVINDMQVDDEFPSLNDSTKINDSKKRAYIPPIVVDKVNDGKKLMGELNALTNEKVTARVVGDKINLQHPTSVNNIRPSTSVTETPKLITSPLENNQSTSNTPLSNNQDILVIKTLLQDFMSKFSTALEALTAQKSSKSSIQ
ncbi:hypothetical protein CDAR_231061 [Caerostris darwini]|uniref:Uncharacterized protein n=1 Tax=Caerostris darwini TaxID=1538125 RepID=A0AAV4SRQ5_9ARAC|nr:hypothetical protein CDAR_231061 [Caerostris darwini]